MKDTYIDSDEFYQISDRTQCLTLFRLIGALSENKNKVMTGNDVLELIKDCSKKVTQTPY